MHHQYILFSRQYAHSNFSTMSSIVKNRKRLLQSYGVSSIIHASRQGASLPCCFSSLVSSDTPFATTRSSISSNSRGTAATQINVDSNAFFVRSNNGRNYTVCNYHDIAGDDKNKSTATTTTTATTTNSSGNTIRPKRIILCRHGESMGNVDDTTYTREADWRISLSTSGKNQATDAGKRLNTLLNNGANNEQCFVYHSPYKRTTETMAELTKQLNWDNAIIGYREEPRIAEQQFGNFQNYEEIQDAKDERIKFGRFFYRFPNGEAGLDVYNRVSSFISTIFRDTQHMGDNDVINAENLNIVIVTHGLTLRLFLMRWFQISVNEFENMYNPDNGFLAVMERKSSQCGTLQWYELTKESANHLRIQKRIAKKIMRKE